MTHILSSQPNEQPKPGVTMAQGGPHHLHHSEHFRGLSMMTRSCILAAAGMHDSDHVSESLDSDNDLAVHSVCGTEATGRILCSRDPLHSTPPTDSESGELRINTNKNYALTR
jgi:hypothetical protein